MNKIQYWLRWIKWFCRGSHDWTTPPNRRWKDDNGNWFGPNMSRDEYESLFEK